MKLDVSVAPEIAILAGNLDMTAPGTASAHPGRPGSPGPRVAGTAAAQAPGQATTDPAAPGQSGPGQSGPGQSGPGQLGPGAAASGEGVTTATIGYLAACLRALVSDPQTWWDLVWFDPHRPVRVALATSRPGCEVWLLVLPPGYRGEAPGQEPSWDVASLVAGEMTDQVSTQAGWQSRALAPGRIRVRGGSGPYRLVNTGGGYAVSLHARSPQG